MECQLKKRWERRKEARPQELLAAALDLFVERGFNATRLDDVAKLAGVSKGTLYLYFANKEELFKAVIRENMVPALDEAEDVIARHEGHSADLFRELVMGWWARVGNTKAAGISKLLMAEAGNFPEIARFHHEEVVKRRDAMIARALERGIARGEFRQVDTKEAISVLAAPIVMLMTWNTSFNACRIDPIDPQHYLDCFIDIFLNGLLCPPVRGKQAV